MKKLILATSVAFAAMTASAQAADLEMERELGLIVSGVVDSWAGVQYVKGPRINQPGTGSETLFATGGEGFLSLPLGDNLSIQNDVKYEIISPFGAKDSNVFGPRYFYQGAVHLSWRDPSTGLFGVFGGMGTADFNPGFDTTARFVGGEVQFYMNDITFYAQGGYVDFSNEFNSNDALDEGFFARGVMRWFLTHDSRLQLEGTYLNADYGNLGLNMEAFSVKARYDFTLASMPMIGDVPIYLAYRGTFRNDCAVEFQSFGVDDHTLMVGSSYSFSGDLLTVDRQGATLDTPDFNYSCAID